MLSKKKVCPSECQENVLVLKHILPVQPYSKGKWMPNYK